MSSIALGGRMEPENLGSATIGKAVKVVGKIYSKEDLIVNGDLEQKSAYFYSFSCWGWSTRANS